MCNILGIIVAIQLAARREKPGCLYLWVYIPVLETVRRRGVRYAFIYDIADSTAYNCVGIHIETALPACTAVY